jgi:hypothetical protein
MISFHSSRTVSVVDPMDLPWQPTGDPNTYRNRWSSPSRPGLKRSTPGTGRAHLLDGEEHGASGRDPRLQPPSRRRDRAPIPKEVEPLGRARRSRPSRSWRKTSSPGRAQFQTRTLLVRKEVGTPAVDFAERTARLARSRRQEHELGASHERGRAHFPPGESAWALFFETDRRRSVGPSQVGGGGSRGPAANPLRHDLKGAFSIPRQAAGWRRRTRRGLALGLAEGQNHERSVLPGEVRRRVRRGRCSLSDRSGEACDQPALAGEATAQRAPTPRTRLHRLSETTSPRFLIAQERRPTREVHEPSEPIRPLLDERDQVPIGRHARRPNPG